MNRKYNYITVDSPNDVPKASTSVPFAQFVDAPLSEKNMLSEDVAQVQIKDMHLPNFSMRVSKGIFYHDALFLNTSASGIDLLGSCLFPEGEFKTLLYNGNEVVESTSGTHNFKYDPLNEFQHRIAAHTPFHIIHFSVSPEHFLKFLPENESWSDLLKEKITKNERMIGSRSLPILLAQERALQIIFDCPLSGKLGEMMIETAITQIMLLQLHAHFQHSTSTERTTSKRDIDVIQNVKEYLSATFLQDHSLESLARHFGTNTNKLMSLFKKTFGKSIFDYISELKMEYAHMLLQNDKMVVEVAREVGYKNPHHFSTAFKRHFGITPSQIR